MRIETFLLFNHRRLFQIECHGIEMNPFLIPGNLFWRIDIPWILSPTNLFIPVVY